MLEFPAVEVEASLVELERYAVLDFAPEHHLIAAHVIHHYVL